METPVLKVRRLLGHSQETMARLLEIPTVSYRNYEKGKYQTPAEVAAKLAAIAATCVPPAPPTPRTTEARFSENNGRWHQLLEYVLNSGVEVAIEAVTKNLIAFHLTARLVRGEAANGTVEGNAPETPPDIAGRIAEFRGLAEQSQAHPEVLRPEKRRTARRVAGRR